jgi:exopolysaccharide biosynthesis protein
VYKKYNCLETCFVNGDGDFLFTELGQSFTREEMEQYIADNDILFSISFGPVLVRDGQVQQCDWYPVGEIDRGYSRAGIGQVDKLHYLYMSLNHSPEKEARWSVNTFAQHFGEKPVKNAYCLDGGQTGEIVFQGRAYNHVDVVNGQKERPVSDNIYFATAIGGTEVGE